MQRPKLGSKLQAIAPGHVEIKQRHIRRGLLRHHQGLISIRRLGTDPVRL
jgi:hypothetical protein